MPGATLSRWTMSYFAAACLFLVIGECMLAAGYGYPFAEVGAPETLALVHLVAIGWLGLLMVGALLQFVPVLVAAPLRGGRLAAPALLLIIAGLLLLLGGFGALAGGPPLSPNLLPLGAVVIVAGFVLVAGMLAATLLAARPLPHPARFVAAGLLALVATVLIGACFAVLLSGAIESDLLTALVVHGVPLHAALGLGGWLSFTAIGVSYRLLPMFMLAPDNVRTTTKVAWWAGTAALGLVAASVGLAVIEPSAMTGLLVLAMLLTLGLTVLYGADAVRFYRKRRRKAVELNIRASYAAFAALIASVAMFALPAMRAAAGEGAAALVYLFVFGWLSGLGLAQLYKIVPFLTWLECYGPVLGRVPVPRVQDLVSERRARLWFYLYYAAVSAATFSLFMGSNPSFRIAALAQLAATIALIVEFARARNLSAVAAASRFPVGVPRPHLFLPPFRHRSEP
ncbi:hypothetical protein [Sinorhizobium alkalisoli]|uniref:hypothetical protein n=1 Tax=Sinorhizobium alkalisoli TaxID=1752398 RepID=UPI00124CB764|nr:hypothetical protein [Sinorhizobium alkalisoli]QFI69264.1 hypothetical protein EKH55_4390 [Sinorhizobium alkalisoli]